MTTWTDAASGARSRTLGIDWSRLRDKPIDPYLLWADLSGFQSIAREGPPTSRAASSNEQLRIAAECAPDGKLPKLPGVSWHEVLRTGEAVFATAFVRAGDLCKVLSHPRVRRVELGFRAPATRRPASTVASRPGEPPVPTTRTTMAVIDFGCAFAHERFRARAKNGSWQSRIAYLWDQGRAPAGSGATPWRAVQGPGYGRELRAVDIDRLLMDHRQESGPGIDEDAVYRHAQYDTVQRVLMHGTHVLDIAAGENPRKAIGSTAQIIFVQLPDFAIDDTSGGSMVTHVLDALRYILDRTDPHKNLVINLSYGAMAGPHDGSTLTEAAMDAAIEAAMGAADLPAPLNRYFRIVLPAGNSFTSDGHAALTLSPALPSQRLHWQVQADNPTDAFLEIWYPFDPTRKVNVVVTAPDGAAGSAAIDQVATLHRTSRGEPIGAIIHRHCSSAGPGKASAVVALAPTRTRDGRRAVAPAGVWTVDIELVDRSPDAASIPVEVWIERDDPPIGSGAPPRQSFLLTGRLPLGDNEDSPEGSLVQRAGTCNSVATGSRTTVVGACSAVEKRFTGMASYSSAGPTCNPLPKAWPDMVASAEVSSALSGVLAAGTRSGILVRMNGTSVAAPKVARAYIEQYLRAEAAAVKVGPKGVTPGPARSLNIKAQRKITRAGGGFLVSK